MRWGGDGKENESWSPFHQQTLTLLQHNCGKPPWMGEFCEPVDPGYELGCPDPGKLLGWLRALREDGEKQFVRCCSYPCSSYSSSMIDYIDSKKTTLTPNSPAASTCWDPGIGRVEQILVCPQKKKTHDRTAPPAHASSGSILHPRIRCKDILITHAYTTTKKTNAELQRHFQLDRS